MPEPRRFTSELTKVEIRVLAFDDHTAPGFNNGSWVSQVGLKPFPFDIVFDEGELDPPPGGMCHSDKPQGCQNLVVLDEPFAIMMVNMNGRMNVLP